MSNVIGFGPLDEKEITVGAALSIGSILIKMLAVGVLSTTIAGKLENLILLLDTSKQLIL